MSHTADTPSAPDPILALFRQETTSASQQLKQLSEQTFQAGQVKAEQILKDLLGAARLARVELVVAATEWLMNHCHKLDQHLWNDFLLHARTTYQFLEYYLSADDQQLLTPDDQWRDAAQFALSNNSGNTQQTTPVVANAAISTTAPQPEPPPSAPAVTATVTVAPSSEPAAAAPEIKIDPALLELFLEEARTHTGNLSNGLVALEQTTITPQTIEPLMRSAHSLKGASRVVGLDSCVEVAHEAEEVLVQAQRGKLQLNQNSIDVLLAAADYLAGAAESLLNNPVQWQQNNESLRQRLLQQLSSILKGEAVASVSLAVAPTPSASEPSPNPEPQTTTSTSSHLIAAPHSESPAQGVSPAGEPSPPSAPAKAEALKSADDNGTVVRVSAKSLSRLMNLAGESLVEARWLQPFSNSLQSLKRRQDQVAILLEDLQQQVADCAPELISGLLQAKRELAECRQMLGDRIGEFEEHARQSDNLNSRLYDEVIASRMRPFGDLAKGLPRIVRDTARRLNKQVSVEIHGEETPVDRDILERLEAPLQHLLRNAVDHGFESTADREASGKSPIGKLRIEAHHHSGMLYLRVSDDGRGISLDRLREKIIQKNLISAEMALQLSEAELLEFLFLPGFSTAEKVTEVSGRGVGLDVVHHLVQSVGGAVRIQTKLGIGTTFILQLPITLSVLRAVLVTIGGQPYALPHNRTERLLRLPHKEVLSLEGRQFFVDNGRNIGLVPAQQLLELPDSPEAIRKLEKDEELSIVLIRGEEKSYGITVDAFKGELDLVVRPLDPRLGRVPNLSAAAILDNGNPVLILDVEDLLRSIDQILSQGKLQRSIRFNARQNSEVRKRILVVDDSITVRELQRQLLTQRGYQVDIAVDGTDGLEMARVGQYDLIVSDIDMPRMNGLEMIRNLKSEPRTHAVPVIVVSYKGRDEDRQMGMQVGANYYLTKSSFQDDSYLDAVHDLIGDP